MFSYLRNNICQDCGVILNNYNCIYTSIQEFNEKCINCIQISKFENFSNIDDFFEDISYEKLILNNDMYDCSNSNVDKNIIDKSIIDKSIIDKNIIDNNIIDIHNIIDQDNISLMYHIFPTEIINIIISYCDICSLINLNNINIIPQSLLNMNYLTNININFQLVQIKLPENNIIDNDDNCNYDLINIYKI